MNQVTLSGNLTRDPELRFTPGGSAIAKFGLAANRKWKDQSGEPKEEVTFIDVDAFGKQAELIGQYFKKGAKILLTGRLKLDQWDDKQSGQKRSKLGVVLESFEFMSGRTQGGENEAPVRTAEPKEKAIDFKARMSEVPKAAEVEEDDVPF